MFVVVVVGNPKPESRTARAACLLAESFTGRPADLVLDLATLGPALLDWNDSSVKEAVSAVSRADLVIVASPTFKATYSGLLKLFLDQFSSGDGLAGTVAIPLMLGAGPAHAMAPDMLLKPVLVELGATCPTPGFYISDKLFEDKATMESVATKWRAVVNASMAAWKEQ
ncbi:NADPH-dependent FMN reductase [Paraburkholderia sediminicola]|uniref:NADPH-dependent FMN reductase n=1 Tax=Paraburkholderia sediminicola TaxID=458836 RepID=UPI0038B785FC